MKHLKINYLFIALTVITVFASCHKDKVAPLVIIEPPNNASRAGLYILNQGFFGANNSTLTYYDYTTKVITPDQYTVANTTKLGDTGNDMGVYGAKMYITVNNSNVVSVVNAKTAKLIKQITLNQPRSVTFYKGNAFVTSYSGTVSVIDTVSLTITKTIIVGSDPEQMVVSNGKLYVANSGGLDPAPATTVSVIDLITLTETKKITVTANPQCLATDGHGNVYVMSEGNYGNIKPAMTVINNATDVVKSQTTLNLGYIIPIVVNGDRAYYFTADNKIAVYNTITQTLVRDNFITDGTTITSPFAITVDDNTAEVFITDAKDYASNGTLYAFDENGKKEYSITTGISPGKVLIANK